jgi:hypothetical protein
MPIEWVPICLSLKEVTNCVAHEVLMYIGDNILLIVGNLQGILVMQSQLTDHLLL